MREIKFRGYSSDMGEWYYGSFIDNSQSDFDSYIQDDSGHFIVIERDTVGQYTGLKDKNGKEIYEGDILTNDYKVFYEIFYDNGSFRIKARSNALLNSDRAQRFEVIGNIHEGKNNG